MYTGQLPRTDNSVRKDGTEKQTEAIWHVNQYLLTAYGDGKYYIST